MEGENSPLALLHHMGEERWHLIFHREGKENRIVLATLNRGEPRRTA
jgi:hypothetical protein